MSKIVLILAVTSAGLGLLSLHLVKEMRAGQATVAELQAQVATLQKQPPPAAPQPVAANTPEIAGMSVPAPSPVTPPLAAKIVTSSVSTPAPNVAQPLVPSLEERLRMLREGRESQRALMQDPDYRDAMRLQSRIGLARAYPGFAEDLGLNRQQTDQFLDLLADQQLRTNELMQPLWEMEGKDSAAIEEQQRKIRQQTLDLQRTHEAELAARFGQDKLQAWQDYQATLGVRHQLEQMRNTLASQGLPVSGDLSKPMMKALAEAEKATAEEFSAGVSRSVGPMSARLVASSSVYSAASVSPEAIEQQIEMTQQRQQRTLDALSPYLTAEQRQALEKEQEAQLKLQRAQMRLMRRHDNAIDPAFPSTPLIAVPPQ